MANRKAIRYSERASIIALDERPEAHLSDENVALLYRFYVLEAPNTSQSLKSRSFSSRGWIGPYSDNGLKDVLVEILDLFTNDFVFIDQLDACDIGDLFDQLQLASCPLQNINWERCVVGSTPGTNPYLKVFHRIRNCLAHGNFRAFESRGSNKGIYLVMEDHSTGRGTQIVTARMVFRMETLTNWAKAVVNGPCVNLGT